MDIEPLKSGKQRPELEILEDGEKLLRDRRRFGEKREKSRSRNVRLGAAGGGERSEISKVVVRHHPESASRKKAVEPYGSNAPQYRMAPNHVGAKFRHRTS